MLRKYFIIGWAMVALMGCQHEDEPAGKTDLVQTDLAMALAPSVPLTRMADGVVQTGDARDIQLLSIVPFSTAGTITTADRPSYYELISTPNVFDHTGSKYYYHQQYYFMPGAASFLVYGKAVPDTPPTGVSTKAHNGSLLIYNGGGLATVMPRLVVPADLMFKLEPIHAGNEASVAAQRIAGYLTWIAQAYGSVGTSTVRWDVTDNSWLKALYLNFIDRDNKEQTSPMAGSASNVKALVSKLYQVMANHTFADNTMEKSIAEAIMYRIAGRTVPTNKYPNGSTPLAITFDETTQRVTNIGTDCDKFPADEGLPDGAAVVQWNNKTGNEGAFEPQTVTTTVTSINNISRYVYPAELYYYTNSRIKTHNSEVSSSIYSSATDWSSVLAQYDYDNAIVTTSTQAAVIKEPLQHGVARLSAKVQATTATLADANGETVNFTQTSFPIRGIIIANQRPVGFDFRSPYTLTTEGKDNEVCFVYDSQVKSGNTIYYLSTTEKGPLNTLVLQNIDGEDVTVILELENNSGGAFKGLNGTIYPGTRFYLIGQIKYNLGSEAGIAADDPNKTDVAKRVFTQDHITEVHLKVGSLAKAYNVLPNILTGRLEIGVQITTAWKQATPSTVVME